MPARVQSRPPNLLSIAAIARALVLAAIGILPAAVDWVCKEYVNPRPFWVEYFDPEAPYFHSGRALLEGRLPPVVEHPGTPVALLSAVIVGWTGEGPEALPSFIRLAHWTLIVLTFAAAATIALSLGADVPWILVPPMIWLFFLCPQSLEYVNVWSPDGLHFAFGGIALALLWAATAAGLANRDSLIVGLSIGVCCGLKFTFVAWALALVLSMVALPLGEAGRRRPSAAWATGGLVLGFGLATCIVASAYPYIFGWALHFLARAGPYGTGLTGSPRVSEILANWLGAVRSAKAWHVALLLVGVMAARDVLSSHAEGAHFRRKAFLLLFSAFGLAASYFMASRHMALRYLLPTGLLGLLLFRMSIESARLRSHAWTRYLLTIVVAILVAKHVVADLDTHAHRIAQLEELRLGARRAIDQYKGDPNPTVVFGYRFPQPSYALRYLAYDQSFLSRVERLYPREGHYNPWNRATVLPMGSSHWDLLVIDGKDVPTFPGGTGPKVATLGEYVIVLPPRPAEGGPGAR